MNEELQENDKPRRFGGAQLGAGRPKKDSIRVSYALATDVVASIETLKTKLNSDKTSVVELAVRELAAREGVGANDASQEK